MVPLDESLQTIRRSSIQFTVLFDDAGGGMTIYHQAYRLEQARTPGNG